MEALKKNHQFFFLFLVAAFCLWFTVNFFFGERIFHRDGIGYDGGDYTYFLYQLESGEWKKGLTQYLSGRWIPSIINYALIKIVGGDVLGNYQFEFYKETVSVAKDNIISSFYLYNFVLLLGCMYLFFRISTLQKWSLPVKLIAFSGLFINFAVLKFIPYYPVLTDCTAFFLGFLMLYFYLIGNQWALLFTALIGAFTFPTLEYNAALFLLFPFNAEILKKEPGISFKTKPLIEKSPALSRLLLSLVAIVLVIIAEEVSKIPSVQGFVQPSYLIFKLSLLTFFFYVLLLLKPFSTIPVQCKLSLYRLMTVIGFLLFVKTCRSLMFSGEMYDAASITSVVKNIFLGVSYYPAIYFVDHFNFFGPIILLIAFYWKEVVTVASRHTGFIAILSLYIFLTLGTESRQYTNILPFFVLLIGEVLNQKNISFKFSLIFLVISLAISKCWLPINQWANSSFFLTPHQTYFMNFGPPWVIGKMYLLQLMVMLMILFVGLWIYHRRKRAFYE